MATVRAAPGRDHRRHRAGRRDAQGAAGDRQLPRWVTSSDPARLLAQVHRDLDPGAAGPIRRPRPASAGHGDDHASRCSRSSRPSVQREVRPPPALRVAGGLHQRRLLPAPRRPGGLRRPRAGLHRAAVRRDAPGRLRPTARPSRRVRLDRLHTIARAALLGRRPRGRWTQGHVPPRPHGRAGPTSQQAARCASASRSRSSRAVAGSAACRGAILPLRLLLAGAIATTAAARWSASPSTRRDAGR